MEGEPGQHNPSLWNHWSHVGMYGKGSRIKLPGAAWVSPSFYQFPALNSAHLPSNMVFSFMLLLVSWSLTPKYLYSSFSHPLGLISTSASTIRFADTSRPHGYLPFCFATILGFISIISNAYVFSPWLEWERLQNRNHHSFRHTVDAQINVLKSWGARTSGTMGRPTVFYAEPGCVFLGGVSLISFLFDQQNYV